VFKFHGKFHTAKQMSGVFLVYNSLKEVEALAPQLFNVFICYQESPRESQRATFQWYR
jgi:hypothetical protein